MNDEALTTATDESLGVVVVDHGSRREASNAMLEAFVADFAAGSQFSIVEPAHMELAEPSIATAFARCVERGAKKVMVVPYFLSPGRHWNQDIPDLTRAAGAEHPMIPWCVSAPIGLHPLMHQVITSRVSGCLEQIAGRQEECEICRGTGRCRFQRTDPAASDEPTR